MWAENNFHACVQFSFNVRAVFIGDHLFGPISETLWYLNFLEHILTLLLEDISLGLCRNIWFMNDGVDTYFCRQTSNGLFK